ncbi:hypothetical protein DFP73DRAFT_556207 [Morchella snyderi]|nr:hypothetical protein DFP73DRAFT_556207 [Morchella snyderi]
MGSAAWVLSFFLICIRGREGAKTDGEGRSGSPVAWSSDVLGAGEGVEGTRPACLGAGRMDASGSGCAYVPTCTTGIVSTVPTSTSRSTRLHVAVSTLVPLPIEPLNAAAVYGTCMYVGGYML